MALLDIVTPAYAIVEPALKDYSLTDPLLLRYITAASAWVQQFLGWEMTADEIAALEEDVKVATTRLVVFMIARSDGYADLQAESLGDYSYSFGMASRSDRRAMPTDIATMLAPYEKHDVGIHVVKE